MMKPIYAAAVIHIAIGSGLILSPPVRAQQRQPSITEKVEETMAKHRAEIDRLQAEVERISGNIEKLRSERSSGVSADFLKRELQLDLIPPGAILMLEARRCPTGWSPYSHAEGRVVVGYAPQTQAGRITAEAPGASGGSRTVQLKEVHLLAHRHEMEVGTLNGEGIRGQGKYIGTSVHGARRGPGYETWTGDGKGQAEPFEIIPLYIGLLFCMKN